MNYYNNETDIDEQFKPLTLGETFALGLPLCSLLRAGETSYTGKAAPQRV